MKAYLCAFLKGRSCGGKISAVPPFLPNLLLSLGHGSQETISDIPTVSSENTEAPMHVVCAAAP